MSSEDKLHGVEKLLIGPQRKRGGESAKDSSLEGYAGGKVAGAIEPKAVEVKEKDQSMATAGKDASEPWRPGAPMRTVVGGIEEDEEYPVMSPGKLSKKTTRKHRGGQHQRDQQRLFREAKGSTQQKLEAMTQGMRALSLKPAQDMQQEKPSAAQPSSLKANTVQYVVSEWRYDGDYQRDKETDEEFVMRALEQSAKGLDPTTGLYTRDLTPKELKVVFEIELAESMRKEKEQEQLSKLALEESKSIESTEPVLFTESEMKGILRDKLRGRNWATNEFTRETTDEEVEAEYRKYKAGSKGQKLKEQELQQTQALEVQKDQEHCASEPKEIEEETVTPSSSIEENQDQTKSRQISQTSSGYSSSEFHEKLGVVTHRLEQIKFPEFGCGTWVDEVRAMRIRMGISYETIGGEKWPARLADVEYPQSKDVYNSQATYEGWTKKIAEMYPGTTLHNWKAKGCMGRHNRSDWPEEVRDLMDKFAVAWIDYVAVEASYRAWCTIRMEPLQRHHFEGVVAIELMTCRKAIVEFVKRCEQSGARSNKFILALNPGDGVRKIQGIHAAECVMQAAIGVIEPLMAKAEEKCRKGADFSDSVEKAADALSLFIRMHPERNWRPLIEMYPALIKDLRDEMPEAGSTTMMAMTVVDESSYPPATPGQVVKTPPAAERIAMEEGSATVTAPSTQSTAGGEDTAAMDVDTASKQDDEGQEKGDGGIKPTEPTKLNEDDMRKDLKLLCIATYNFAVTGKINVRMNNMYIMLIANENPGERERTLRYLDRRTKPEVMEADRRWRDHWMHRRPVALKLMLEFIEKLKREGSVTELNALRLYYRKLIELGYEPDDELAKFAKEEMTAATVDLRFNRPGAGIAVPGLKPASKPMTPQRTSDIAGKGFWIEGTMATTPHPAAVRPQMGATQQPPIRSQSGTAQGPLRLPQKGAAAREVGSKSPATTRVGGAPTVPRSLSQSTVFRPGRGSTAGSTRPGMGTQRRPSRFGSSQGGKRYFDQPIEQALAKNRVPLKSVFAGTRALRPELMRQYGVWTTSPVLLEYRVIYARVGYAVGFYERILNKAAELQKFRAPRLMMFGQKESDRELLFTVGETMTTTQYRQLVDMWGNALPFQGLEMPLEDMVVGGMLVPNQIATRGILGKASPLKVFAAMGIVESSSMEKTKGLESWTIGVHSGETFGVTMFENDMVSYLFRQIPLRGELVSMDGFRVANRNQVFTLYGCFFLYEIPGSVKIPAGFYPSKVHVNHHLEITDDLQVGWTEADTNKFTVMNRISTELCGALISFDSRRDEESNRLAYTRVGGITFKEEFLYEVKLDITEIFGDRERMRAISNMKQRVAVYELLEQEGVMVEVRCFKGFVEKQEFRNRILDSLVVRHCVDVKSLADLNLMGPEGEEGDDAPRVEPGEGLSMRTLEKAMESVQQTIGQTWSADFVKALEGKELYIKRDESNFIARKAHNMIKLAKGGWDPETPQGRIKSILCGGVVGPDKPFNWDVIKRKCKDNTEVAVVNAEATKVSHMDKRIDQFLNLDEEQREAIKCFLTRNVSVTVMEAFGGSGKTFTIGNITSVFTKLKLMGGRLVILSKTNESVQVIAQELARSKTIDQKDVLLIQSLQAAQRRMHGRAHEFTMEAKARYLLTTRGIELADVDRGILNSFVAVAQRGIQLGHDMSKVRRVIMRVLNPCVILTTSDMAFSVAGLVKEATHLMYDEGSVAEDGKARALVMAMPNLQSILVSGDPGQLEPFTNVREEWDLIRFGMASVIVQLIERGTCTVVTLKNNRRSIESLLPPIRMMSPRYSAMVALKPDPDWTNDPYVNYPPTPMWKCPYVIIDVKGMHEEPPGGSIRNRYQEDLAQRYLNVLQKLEEIKAIPKKKTLMLSFYTGADIAMRDTTANMELSVECNTVDSAMGKQANTVVATTSRAEWGYKAGSTSMEGLFIAKGGRVRVMGGRPEERMVVIGRMDLCTAQKGPFRDYLRKIAESTPVVNSQYIEMLENWLGAIVGQLEKGLDLKLEDLEFTVAGRYQLSMVLRKDLVYGKTDTENDLSFIANCRLNDEFGWHDLRKHLPESHIRAGYEHHRVRVDYDAPLEELVEEKAELARMLAAEARFEAAQQPLEQPPAIDTAPTAVVQQDPQAQTDMDTTVMDTTVNMFDDFEPNEPTEESDEEGMDTGEKGKEETEGNKADGESETKGNGADDTEE